MKSYILTVEFKRTYKKNIFIDAPTMKDAKLLYNHKKFLGTLFDGSLEYSGDYGEEDQDIPVIKSIKSW
tara:strand:+ start:114 stop:320 length:207 start_codon:yes stop_codon:yes gene_type:complete